MEVSLDPMAPSTASHAMPLRRTGEREDNGESDGESDEIVVVKVMDSDGESDGIVVVKVMEDDGESDGESDG